MLQSHESYSSCGLGSERTDALVALVRHMAAQQSPPLLFGAKITGGGCGGELWALLFSIGVIDAASATHLLDIS